jgi:RimJ/RimL family protein N-acetyltransferase
MWEFETDRLGFLKITKEHGAMMYDLNSDPEVMRYTGEKAFKNLEEAILFCDNYNPYDASGMGRYSCFLKGNQDFIGWCGLKRHENNLVDLGFRLKKSAWGNGYATEAAQYFLAHGFINLKVNLIIGTVARSNHASKKVLEKIGMRFEKEIDEDCGDTSTFRYKITKEEWKSLKSKENI